eukprot:TRINITY_DN10620_c0_g1_i1.p1 TRINITY_DN10620_c0_g1~~TRINITY_DN10620_c0_g1_i1.p1  ORF type:complete len:157 (+),score=18.44 TRINITY_DN10620_c0_g1_i1:38-508(+)
MLRCDGLQFELKQRECESMRDVLRERESEWEIQRQAWKEEGALVEQRQQLIERELANALKLNANLARQMTRMAKQRRRLLHHLYISRYWRVLKEYKRSLVYEYVGNASRPSRSPSIQMSMGHHFPYQDLFPEPSERSVSAASTTSSVLSNVRWIGT